MSPLMMEATPNAKSFHLKKARLTFTQRVWVTSEKQNDRLPKT